MSAAALDVQDVTAGSGGADVLSAVTLHAAAGRIATIAGPNGAGKTLPPSLMLCSCPATSISSHPLAI